MIRGKVAANETGWRLDRWMKARNTKLSQTRLRQLIEQGCCRVNKKIESHPSYKLQRGDQIEFDIKTETAREEPTIIWSNEDWVAVNKPRGLPVGSDTEIKSWARDLAEGPLRLVHRLDKETSGLLMLARSDAAHAEGMRIFKERLCSKTYLGLIEGTLKREDALIKTHHGKVRSKDGKHRWGAQSEGQEAITRILRLSANGTSSLVRLEPHTGRTHQLRVHMADGGHPIIGDVLYGRGKLTIQSPRMMLHAWQLRWPLDTGDQLLVAPVPEAFVKMAKAHEHELPLA